MSVHNLLKTLKVSVVLMEKVQNYKTCNDKVSLNDAQRLQHVFREIKYRFGSETGNFSVNGYLLASRISCV